MIDKAHKDHELILAIQTVLSTTVRTVDMLDDIIDLLREYGYEVL